jgi:hypothetical protein
MPLSKHGLGFLLEPEEDEAIQGFTDEVVDEI